MSKNNQSINIQCDHNVDWYFSILNAIQEQIRFADSKAGFIAALNTAEFGFLILAYDDIELIYFKIFDIYVILVLFALSVIFMGLSIIFVSMTVASRLGKNAPTGKIFFGHIASNCGNDYYKYYRETINYKDRDWIQEIGTQIVEVSHIALSKHRLIKRSVKCTILSLFCWIFALFIVILVK